MEKIRDLLRPVFRVVVHPHIRNLCKSTSSRFYSYQNKYIGKRCFIVANGPSLKTEDLDILSENKEITFGMNRIYVLYDKTKWRPTFYVTQDPTVIRSSYTEIKEQINNSEVFIKVPGEPRFDLPGAINIDIDYSKYEKKLSPDFLNGEKCKFADGRSVTYTAMQLAVFMGFKKIYLLGLDCSYSKDNKTIDQSSYADSRMYDKTKVGDLPNMEYTYAAYRAAKNYTEKNGIKIFNATRGGKLEIFERVDFDILF